MLYGSYHFGCQFQTEAILPSYKGSTYRGVFGRALKQVICALRRQECPECLLKSNCIYPLVFEPQLTLDAQNGNLSTIPPHPFVIRPPLETKTQYLKGDAFEFGLLLFGPANSKLPYFVYAFDRMGKIGIGKKIEGQRGKFHLKKVTSNNKVIYTDTEQKLADTGPPRDLHLNTPDKQNATTQTITIKLKTPLRIKFRNALSPELPFHVLVRAMLRRVSALFEHYDQGEPELDYSGLVQRSQRVEAVDSSLKWIDWKRYSHRQDQAMMMGGLKGSITYKGDIGEFLPLIDLCSMVHLGKQTTFGLGQIEVEDLK